MIVEECEPLEQEEARLVLPFMALALSVVFAAVGVGALVYTARREPPKTAAAVEMTAVYFTPGGQPTTAVVNELKRGEEDGPRAGVFVYLRADREADGWWVKQRRVGGRTGAGQIERSTLARGTHCPPAAESGVDIPDLSSGY